QQDFAVFRFNANGSLDTTFDGDGFRILDIDAGRDSIGDIAIQPDGKIVAVGQAFTNDNNPIGSQDIALVRLNTNGSLDTTFGGGDGIVVTDIDPTFTVSQDFAHTVVVESSGKLVVEGRAAVGSGPLNSDFAIARYNANGTLDTTFASGSAVPGAEHLNFG